MHGKMKLGSNVDSLLLFCQGDVDEFAVLRAQCAQFVYKFDLVKFLHILIPCFITLKYHILQEV